MSKKNLSTIFLLTLALTSVTVCFPVLAKSAQPQPNNIHGSGYGFYNSPEGRWVGEVWAHYDESGNPDNPQGVWEVGIEGFAPHWYTWGYVDFEKYNGNILIAKGTFDDFVGWALGGRSFVYIANLKTMKWILNGEGFHFKGEIEVIDAYD